jgi:hypothetical protein
MFALLALGVFSSPAVIAAAEPASSTLTLVNATSSHVDFVINGWTYRVEGGASRSLSIAPGSYTIDTYDRNGKWVKRYTLSAAANMIYTYRVWVE